MQNQTIAQIIDAVNRGPFAHLGEIIEKGDDIEISFRVTGYEDPSVNTDTIEVTVSLFFTGDDDEGVKRYDADVHVDNGDFASLDEMLRAFEVVNKKFKELGLNTRFGTLTGE